MTEVIENVARAIRDESGAYTVSSAKNSRGERGFYVRRRDSAEDFEPIAGPFATDAEADAEIARIIGRAAIEALREPSEDQIYAIKTALRTQRGGVSGMTIEAQFRAEHAREFAAWTAAIDAILKEPGNE